MTKITEIQPALMHVNGQWTTPDGLALDFPDSTTGGLQEAIIYASEHYMQIIFISNITNCPA